MAICSTCQGDNNLVESVGKLMMSADASSADFVCRPCMLHQQRQRDEALLQTVGGPGPVEILKTIAASNAWYLAIRRASPEEMLTALNRLKRRTDFSSTANELAAGLASKEVLPALLLQTMAKEKADPLCQRALESYVTSKCPSIKYKYLLLPELGGSLDKARRHFSEQATNPDALVAALAQERLFLMDWITKQSTPAQKKKERHSLGVPDAPYEPTEWLYCTYKSLSIKIKCTAARNDAATLLIKNWYLDTLVVAHNLMSRRVVRSAAAAMSSSSSASFYAGPVQEPAAKKARAVSPATTPGPLGGNSKGKGKNMTRAEQKREAAPFETAMDYNRVPDVIKAFIRPGLNVTQANKALREAFHADKNALYLIFYHCCRNCWAAGKGWVKHSLAQCRQSGNPCSLQCPMCGNGQLHWAEQCPKKR